MTQLKLHTAHDKQIWIDGFNFNSSFSYNIFERGHKCMKKTLKLLLPLLAMLSSCGQAETNNQPSLIKSFNVLEYDSLAIYANGNTIDYWARSAVQAYYYLNYYTELKLDIYTNYYQVVGKWTASDTTKEISMIYSSDCQFKLSKTMY